jgi:hypothetical protein
LTPSEPSDRPCRISDLQAPCDLAARKVRGWREPGNTAGRASADDRLGDRGLGESLVTLPGLEPQISSLSGIEGSALYGPAFPQVACERQRRRDAFLAASFQMVQASQAGLQRPSPDSSTSLPAVAEAWPADARTKHNQTGAVLAQGAPTLAPRPENVATGSTPTQTAAVGDPDPDRRGAGGQRRMGEQQRPAPLTGG